MSGKFEGFSQEDIHKLSSKNFRTTKVGSNNRTIRKLPETKNSKAIGKNEKKITEVENTQETDESMTSLQEAVHFRPLSMKTSKKENSDESILHIETDNITSKKESKDFSPFKGISLKDFEAQRKLVEEQNKQKKELLYKAIERQSQRTAAETKKIEEIKAELAQLDNEFAADVAILRKQIEAACMNYYKIQKQYEKIESQFLKAKLDLHNASEKKELLTEHLCTVIAHNEDRKAKKLSELMEKVGLSSNGELDITQN